MWLNSLVSVNGLCVLALQQAGDPSGVYLGFCPMVVFQILVDI